MDNSFIGALEAQKSEVLGNCTPENMFFLPQQSIFLNICVARFGRAQMFGGLCLPIKPSFVNKLFSHQFLQTMCERQKSQRYNLNCLTVVCCLLLVHIFVVAKHTWIIVVVFPDIS